MIRCQRSGICPVICDLCRWLLGVRRWTFPEIFYFLTSTFYFSSDRYLSPVKSVLRILFALSLFPFCALASNSVVNLSHYDLMRIDFVAMKSEGVVGVIHEASFPRLERDWRYAERQLEATRDEDRGPDRFP